MAAVSKQALLSWSASGAVHLGACLLMACIGLSLPGDPDLPRVDSAWLPPDGQAVQAFDESPIVSLSQLSADPGGSFSEGAEAGFVIEEATSVSEAPNVVRNLQASAIPTEVLSISWSHGDLAGKVGPRKRSRGKGNGTGDGEGNGKGFFGRSSGGAQRIVYVVDNSGSMNYPHPSESKTRFNRVKVELVNSIFYMEPHQQFYVIFFNSEAVPMHAKQMLSATPETKERYLKWVATMEARGGPTDPRRAMELALSFKPDIIYFLTDGEFIPPANRSLGKLKQEKAVIHTFAFGDDFSEALMNSLAEQNGGRFTIIP